MKPAKRGDNALVRDLAGRVHTPAGFLSRDAYRAIVRDNPDAGLPEYEHLPLAK